MRNLEHWEMEPWRLKAIAVMVNRKRRAAALEKGASYVFSISESDVREVLSAAAGFEAVEPD